MIGFALIFQMHLVKYLEAVLHQEVQVAGKGRVSQRNTLSFCVPHLRQILTQESASEKVSPKRLDYQNLAYKWVTMSYGTLFTIAH